MERRKVKKGEKSPWAFLAVLYPLYLPLGLRGWEVLDFRAFRVISDFLQRF